MYKSYEDAYRRSLEDREGFWSIAGGAITWEKKWDKVLDESRAPFYRWFAGGKMNTCYNALDYHVENGRGDQTAIIYDSPVTGTVNKITYKELLEKVSAFAGVLKALGVEKGDRVVIYMPMILEAAVSMLVCARIGAIHSLVFDGFAANE
nr:acetyl-coenzyme A synthetase N-terminal domain-containing protein [Deltaproteobacteria bacterium]